MTYTTGWMECGDILLREMTISEDKCYMVPLTEGICSHRRRKQNSGWEFGEESWEVVEMDNGGCTRQVSFTSETYCKNWA